MNKKYITTYLNLERRIKNLPIEAQKKLKPDLDELYMIIKSYPKGYNHKGYNPKRYNHKRYNHKRYHGEHYPSGIKTGGKWEYKVKVLTITRLKKEFSFIKRRNAKVYSDTLLDIYKKMVKRLKFSSEMFADLYKTFSYFYVITKKRLDTFFINGDIIYLEESITHEVYPSKMYQNYYELFSRFDVIDENEDREDKTDYVKFIVQLQHVILKAYRYYILNLMQIKLFREFILFWIYSQDEHYNKKYVIIREKLIDKKGGGGMLSFPSGKIIFDLELEEYDFGFGYLKRHKISRVHDDNFKRRTYKNKIKDLSVYVNNTEKKTIDKGMIEIGNNLFLKNYHLLAYSPSKEKSIIGFTGIFREGKSPQIPDYLLESMPNPNFICLKPYFKFDAIEENNTLLFDSDCGKIILTQKVNNETSFKFDRKILKKDINVSQVSHILFSPAHITEAIKLEVNPWKYVLSDIEKDAMKYVGMGKEDIMEMEDL